MRVDAHAGTTSWILAHPGPIAALSAWGLGVAWVAHSGALAALVAERMPALALLVFAGIVLPLSAYAGLPAVTRAVDALGLRRITLLHVWRVPAAVAFFVVGLRGDLPPLFWVVAGVGDLLAGLFAATLLWRPATPERLRRIHRFGLADFVVAVGLGLAHTLAQDPRMITLTTLPMALIPLFGVGLSGASHVIALRALRRPAATG